MNLDVEGISKLISRIGFPATMVLILLYGLMPRIDHVANVADEVNGKLNFMVYNCQPVTVPRNPIP